MPNDLQITHDEAVPGLAWLTLDRPDARNAYSDAMVVGIVEALDAFEADDDVRVVAVTGAGSAFSAGGDLKRMLAHDGMFAGDALRLRDRYLRGIQRVPRRFARFDKPVIAALNGPAVGAGLDLACMCDFRVASTRAKLGSTFAAVGLVPGDGGAWFLTRTIGFPKALELILTARVIGADEALSIGLVHEVVADEGLHDAVRRRAAVLARLPPVALQLAKSAAYRSWDLPLEGALELAATYQGIAQNTADHDEAVRAFLEKRDPVFTGR
ncbi:MAG: enoyl-CoA hydratase/isomerase family protein [Alphaproteobacteria bacterium]|nr:enoyl-CoA hydratase/isomerase family protein [Alphaproteobacteria bacterium]